MRSLAFSVLLVGCAVSTPHPEPVSPAPTTDVSPVASPRREAPALSPVPAASALPDPIVLVSDPEALQGLDLEFGRVLFAVEERTTLAMRKSRRFRELARTIRDIDGLPGSWLRSERTTLELAAIVNRLDRRDVMPGTCGETRLIYRLVRDGEEAMPVGLAARFVQPDDGEGCRTVADAWRVSNAEALREGPLSDAALAGDRLVAIESNTRVGDRNSLAILEPNPEPRWDRASWREGILEFDPDAMFKGRGWRRVAELLSEPEMRQVIFDGVPNTRDRSIRYPSWTSTARDSFERVEQQLPDDGDYAPFDDKQAFLARGRTLTCGGCHSTRAVDGFHASKGVSEHLADETVWRRDYVRAVSDGESPARTRLPVEGVSSAL